ncbi:MULTISPECIES: hypothetical protein [Paraburkholderia]|uniref:hypothetical protein n=1 Tax=Paraburkholderia TaxID=1822464 RepID=UPI0002553782|nr:MULTISPECIES: hypothetical protein [Paraburkholderia]MDR8397183.1 hypothetical protein [Paraburkholderia sp. USG1]
MNQEYGGRRSWQCRAHGKAQTTGVGIKDERHRVAINPVRDNVWFRRMQHVSLLCQTGIVA